MPPKTAYYLWFDTEYTTLDLDAAQLLQVSMIATDAKLQRLRPVSADINFYIHLEDGQYVQPWVQDNLPGVLEQCRGQNAVSVEDADERIAQYLDEIFGAPPKEVRQRPVIAGNSVHADWYLVRRFLPKLEARAHYRLLDVTTVKLEWLRWFGGTGFDKENPAVIQKFFRGSALNGNIGPHDAYYDVQASIAELAFYRSRLMRRETKKGES